MSSLIYKCLGGGTQKPVKRKNNTLSTSYSGAKKSKSCQLNHLERLQKIAIHTSSCISMIMPSSVCAMCGKILYANDILYSEKDKILFPQVPIQPDSHYSITEKGSKISLCRQCSRVC